jgi:hypothetical protein
MKKSGKILVGAIIALAFIIGYFVGVMVDFPPVEKSKLAGTIGKIDNYRNVKVSEKDINLRSELKNNNQMLGDFQRYYSFHYTNNVEKSAAIDETLESCKGIAEFTGTNQKKIDALDQYNKFITEARKDILIALMALRHLSEESADQSIGIPLNNANNAIAQMSYRGTAVLDMVEALDDFLSERPSGSFPALAKAHDDLLLSQIRTSVATNDKLMLKYLDKKEFFGSNDDIKSNTGPTNDQVNSAIVTDSGQFGSSDVVGSNGSNQSNQVVNLVVGLNYSSIVGDTGTIGLVGSGAQSSHVIFDAGAVGTNFAGSFSGISDKTFGYLPIL